MSASAAPDDALRKIEIAFNNFGQIITSGDEKVFRSLSIAELRRQIHSMEKTSSKTTESHLRRIVTFVNAVDKYSEVMGILCQGTPYLCFLWAPIKLVIIIAQRHSEAFDNISAAYQLIGHALPRFDRYADVLKDRPDFISGLSEYYVDILDFHSRAYTFLRRNSWKTLFFSSWKSYNNQFRNLLDNLERTTALVDREAQACEIIEAFEFRRISKANAAQEAIDRASWQLRDIFSWLGSDQYESAQIDEYDQHLSKIHPGTCRWLLDIGAVKNWMLARQSHSLWLSGKPGAGKSLLSASLVAKLAQAPRIAVMYFYCAATVDRKNAFGVVREIFKVAITQLLRCQTAQMDLVSHVHQEYIAKNYTPNLPVISRLLSILIGAFPKVFWIIDGLDELEGGAQDRVVSQIASIVSSSGSVMPLFSARDTTSTCRFLERAKKFVITEAEGLHRDIQSMVEAKLEIEERRFRVDDLLHIRDVILEKADGMFLWVELALSCLKSCCNSEELLAVAEDLPRDLEKMYDRIFETLKRQPDTIQRRANRIFNWVIFAARLMLAAELRVAVCLYRESREINENNWLTEDFLDICKPLVETRSNGRVAIIHLSAKEYLLRYHLTPLLGHITIVIGCELYLLSCRVFLNFSDTKAAYESISRGYHRLNSYVLQNWPFHVTSLLMEPSKLKVTLNNDISDESMTSIRNRQTVKELELSSEFNIMYDFRLEVEEQLWSLSRSLPFSPASWWAQVRAATRQNGSSFYGPSPWAGHMPQDLETEYKRLPWSTQVDNEIKTLNVAPEQHPVIVWHLVILQVKKWERINCDNMRALEIHLRNTDPTFLTNIHFRQRAVIEELASYYPRPDIDKPSPSTLTQEKAGAALMTAYNHRPYLCIFGDCPSSCDGFELAEERDDHERSHFRWIKPSTRSHGFLDGDGGPPPPWKGRTKQRYEKIRNDQTECHRQILQNARPAVQEEQQTPATTTIHSPARAGAQLLRRRAARGDLRIRPEDGPLQDLSRFDPEPPVNIPVAVPQPSMGGWGGGRGEAVHVSLRSNYTPALSHDVALNHGGRIGV